MVPATACTSSTITVSTPRSDSRAWLVSIRNSDSGVVIRMSGGWVTSLRRSAAGVSPERTPTVTSGTVAAEPVGGVADAGQRGAQVALDVDGERLERGDVEDPASRLVLSAGRSLVSSRSRLHRNALSVLPEPVGATTSACCPAPIASHAPTWAGVGSANAAANQVRVGSLNRLSASAGVGMPPSLAHATDSAGRAVPRVPGYP